MNADEYLSAALPETVTLLGQRLMPFSLGHYKRLLRWKNWFVLPIEDRADAPPQLHDLIMGVWICCQSWEECTEGLFDRNLHSKLKKWGENVGKFDFAGKCNRFTQYIADGSKWPEVHNPAHSGRSSGSPFVHRVQMILQGKLGHSLSEALNKPWGEAIWDYFGFWEMEGAVQLFSQDDVENRKMASAMDDAIARILARGETLTHETIVAEMEK
ncbi:MAG TPA: hypothetical protein VNO50_10965 [Pyrinomonadaceae bacterium]|nr:hypothetical protein [Pyrinomonadaceae bacterium]